MTWREEGDKGAPPRAAGVNNLNLTILKLAFVETKCNKNPEKEKV